MATNRSRRLRKKLCVDEFQELGFELQLSYPEGTEDAVIEAFFADLVVDAIESNGMALIGGIGFLIAAFRTSILWGLAVLLIAPVAIVYLIPSYS